MKTTSVIVSLASGGVAVMSFLTEGRGSYLPAGARWVSSVGSEWAREPSRQNISDEVSRAFAGATDTVVSFRVISQTELPTDREYRNAWTDDGTTVTHDMGKAKELRRNQLRHERAALLPQLDAEWMRATGQGDKKAADDAETARQKLRDAPADPRIDAATTIEQLKLITLPE